MCIALTDRLFKLCTLGAWLASHSPDSLFWFTQSGFMIYFSGLTNDSASFRFQKFTGLNDKLYGHHNFRDISESRLKYII